MSMDTNSVKGRSRISRNSIIHYRNKNCDVEVKWSDLKNDAEQNRQPRVGHVNFALGSTDSISRRSHGFQPTTSRRKSKKFKCGFQVSNQPEQNPTNQGVSADATTTSYCCILNPQKFCKTARDITCDGVTTEKKMPDETNKTIYEAFEESENEIEEIQESNESINGSIDLKEGADELETRVIGCKFEFTYRLPQLGQLLGLRRRRGHSRTNCMNRCKLCKRKRRNSRNMDQSENYKKVEDIQDVAKTDNNASKLDDFEEIESTSENYEQQPMTYRIDSLTHDWKGQPWQQAKKQLVTNNNGYGRRRGGGSGEPTVTTSRDMRRYASVCNTTKNTDTIKKLLQLENKLYYKNSQQLHILYNNLNYKVLQSLTSATSCLNDVTNNDFNIHPHYSTYSNKTYQTCLEGVESGNTSAVCNEINYEDALENVNGIAKSALRRVNIKCGSVESVSSPKVNPENQTKRTSPRLSKPICQAVLSLTTNSSLMKPHKKPTTKGNGQRSVNDEWQIQESPQSSEMGVTESNLENYMDNIYDTSLLVKPKSETSDTTFTNEESANIKTIRFEKLPPLLHTDNATFIRIYVHVSATYERLVKLENRIKRLMIDLQIECDPLVLKPQTLKKSKSLIVPEIPEEYKRINYTITRDENDANVMHINPPTDDYFKTCDCKTNEKMDCMKIDFAAKFEPPETCSICMDEYTVLVEELCHKHNKDQNDSFYKRLCNFFTSILPFEPAECSDCV